MDNESIIKIERMLWDRLSNSRVQAINDNDIAKADIIGDILNEISEIISGIINENESPKEVKE